MKTLWLDCDPGHDDAMALVLAAFHPEARLLGVSTVAGNQSLAKTTANARAVLKAFGLEALPVIPGQDRALLGAMPYCAEIHGQSGLDGPHGKPLFPWSEPLDIHPETGTWPARIRQLLVKAADKTGEKVRFVATGSLTNPALLLSLYPDLGSYIDLSLMGGAIGPGNTGPAAEFNIENDPEAAHIVFSSGLHPAMVPLEVTHTAQVTPELLQRLGSNSPFRKTITELLLYFRDTYRRVFGFENPPLHDPLAVWYALFPADFQARDYHVAIERGSPLSRGQTVVDLYRRTPHLPNARVCEAVDLERFWSGMFLALDRAEVHFRS